MNQKTADLPKRENKQQNRKPHQPTRDGTGNKYEHKHWYIISQHQVVSNHLPQTWKAEQTIAITCLTFHPRCATDLYADILLVKVQNIYTLAIISLAKKGVLTHKQVIKNPSHPKGVVSVSNLSYLIICVLQLAQIHPVSTFSYSISLHLLLLNWKALYYLSSTDICKIQLSHFT